MEGLSVINCKNKEIIFVDHSVLSKDPNQKEKTIKLIKETTTEYQKRPKNSVLGLVNVEGSKFDMEILNVFKEEGGKIDPYEKKVAVYGVKGLQKAGYNFVVGLINSKYKVFETEVEAKEWLVKD